MVTRRTDTTRRIRVLVVDDSAVVRTVLSKGLAADPAIEVIGTATDPYIARDKIVRLKPDVMTLDVEMPRMDGITFLRKVMRYHPLPVVIVSSLSDRGGELTLRALEAGAVEVLAKPSADSPVEEICEDLAYKIKAALRARVGTAAAARSPSAPPPVLESPGANSVIVALGASTGGTQAIQLILEQMPADAPGMVIVQHMPQHFTRSFAARLDSLCAMHVVEAAGGELVEPGVAIIAPGDRHAVLRRRGAVPYVEVRGGPRVNRHRPSVDVLFKSVARADTCEAVGVLLTGMGSDGARGLLEMKEAGAHTLVQDEASCVVYGMPREAMRLGAARETTPLEAIAAEILRAAARTSSSA
jgi:two-component system chemotaxis response regulator CheB